MAQRELTRKEAAKFANVAQRTINKWFDRGELRGRRADDLTPRIPPAELVRFMESYGMPVCDELRKLTDDN